MLASLVAWSLVAGATPAVAAAGRGARYPLLVGARAALGLCQSCLMPATSAMAAQCALTWLGHQPHAHSSTSRYHMAALYMRWTRSSGLCGHWGLVAGCHEASFDVLSGTQESSTASVTPPSVSQAMQTLPSPCCMAWPLCASGGLIHLHAPANLCKLHARQVGARGAACARAGDRICGLLAGHGGGAAADAGAGGCIPVAGCAARLLPGWAGVGGGRPPASWQMDCALPPVQSVIEAVA